MLHIEDFDGSNPSTVNSSSKHIEYKHSLIKTTQFSGTKEPFPIEMVLRYKHISLQSHKVGHQE